MINEQGAPYSKRRRVYGCKCDEMMSSNIEAGLGIVVTQAEIDAYSAQHPPMQDPFGGGLTPAIFHHYGSGYIAYRDVGGVKKLICPINMYYEFQHATVDCAVPQERQIFWQDQAGHPTVKIALNGVMQETGGGQVQSFQSATCGGNGVYPHPCLGTPPDDFVDTPLDALAPGTGTIGTVDPVDIDMEDPGLTPDERFLNPDDPRDDTDLEPQQTILGVGCKTDEDCEEDATCVDGMCEQGDLSQDIIKRMREIAFRKK